MAIAQVHHKSVKRLSVIFSAITTPESGFIRAGSLTSIERADPGQPRKIFIRRVSSNNVVNDDDDDEDVGPLYSVDAPQESNLDEMIATIADPVRGELFRNFAKQNMLEENVDFLSEVLAFRKAAEDELVKKSSQANYRIREVAQSLYLRFIRQGAADEVNVPSRIRLQIESVLLQNSSWVTSNDDNVGNSKDGEEDAPFIARELARDVLKDDPRKRGILFEPAFKEILTLLYQNIWSKFLAHEAEVFAVGNGSNANLPRLRSVHSVHSISV